MEQAENRATELQKFTEEIAELSDREKRERETAHFSNSNFNPSELTWEDKLIWDKVKDASITREEFNTYRADIIDPRTRSVKDDVAYSRYTFFSFIGNKATRVIGMREFAEEKKKKI